MLAMRRACFVAFAAVLGTPLPSAAAAPDNTGSWTGKASQVGRPGSYIVTVTLTKKDGTSLYPDQQCNGKLTRVGGSGNYVFYAEAITSNRFDATKKKGCLDGSITLLRSGNTLIYGWLGSYNDKPIIAYATLIKQ